MPFIERCPAIMKMKLKSWEINPRKPGIHIDTVGVKWPDILGNGAGHPHEFHSTKVLSTFQKNNISLATVTEIPIAVIRSKRLKNIPPPEYYVLEAPFGIECDTSGSDFDVNGKPIKSTGEYELVLKLSTWNGSDLMARPTVSNVKQPWYNLICTERIKELAKKDGWTNVRFDPVKCL
jgi:hypothetical protein